MTFIFAEFGCTGSLDSNNRLNLDGRFQSKHLESVIRKYIIEYIKCKACNSIDTEFTKEDRLSFVSCKKCKSQKQLQNINKGFKPNTHKSRMKVV